MSSSSVYLFFSSFSASCYAGGWAGGQGACYRPVKGPDKGGLSGPSVLTESGSWPGPGVGFCSSVGDLGYPVVLQAAKPFS